MKKIVVTTLLSLGFFISKAQNIRTFNNFELSTSFSRNTNQYAIFWGETLQLKAPVPLRLVTGVRYSLINKTKGLYPSTEGTLENINFLKRPWYNTFAIPIGLELYFKGFSVGGFQEVISLSGRKKFNETFTTLAEEEILRTQGFSAVFGKKQNLTSGVYAAYTFNDSFTLKVGFNRITSTFNKSNETKDLGYSRLSDDTFNIGLRINIEK